MKNNKKHYTSLLIITWHKRSNRPRDIINGGVTVVLIVEQDGAGSAFFTIGLEVTGVGLGIGLGRSSGFLEIHLGVRLRQFLIVLYIGQTFGIVHDLFHGGVQRGKFDTHNVFIVDEFNMGCIAGDGMTVEGVRAGKGKCATGGGANDFCPKGCHEELHYRN